MPPVPTIPGPARKGAARSWPEKKSRATAKRHPTVPGRQEPQSGSTLARHSLEVLDRRQQAYLDRRQHANLRALYLFVVEDFLLPPLHSSYGGELPDRDGAGDFEEPLRYAEGPPPPFYYSSVPFRRQAYPGGSDRGYRPIEDPLSSFYRAFKV